MFVNIMKYDEISNLEMLSIAAKVTKHVEEIGIKLNFSDNFKLEDIPDDIIISLLDNVEYRLSIFGGSMFVIIRRLSDDRVVKCEVTEDNEEVIKNMF